MNPWTRSTNLNGERHDHNHALMDAARAMSRENVDGARAFGRGTEDIRGLPAHLSSDVEGVRSAPRWRQDIRGDEVRTCAQSEIWERLLLCAEAFKQVGTELVVSGHWEAVGRSGVDMSAPATWVFGFRNGKIAYWQAYTSKAAALDAVGLRD
jgi:ketosteroid isomerase-like protein